MKKKYNKRYLKNLFDLCLQKYRDLLKNIEIHYLSVE